MKNLFRNLTMILISMTLISITACKKDEDDETKPAAPATEKSKIINRDFKVTDVLSILNADTIMTFADYNQCNKDDITIFMDDSTGTTDAGSTKCDSGDPQQTSFTWSLESKDKVLKINSEVDTYLYDIIINNGTTLKIENTQVDDFTGNGQDDELVTSLTFTKQ